MRRTVNEVLESQERQSLRLLKQNYVEDAFTHVRNRILAFSLKPGENVGDAQIAGALGISRTPVREALRRLELEGLVLHVPHRGWTVRRLQIEDITEIFEIKECLESLLVKQATPCLTEETKAVLVKAVGTMEAAANTGDRQAFLAADDSFHDVLRDAASNGRAKQILSSVNAQWRWIRIGLAGLQGRLSQAAQEHRLVLDHVLAGDAEGAAAATSESIVRVKLYLLNLLHSLALPLAASLDHRQGLKDGRGGVDQPQSIS
jgi:DNA-binding GntR family transcriptional regulator